MNLSETDWVVIARALKMRARADAGTLKHPNPVQRVAVEKLQHVIRLERYARERAVELHARKESSG